MVLLSTFDIVDAIRLSFVGAAFSVLSVYFIPALRSRFLDYGARSGVGRATAIQHVRSSDQQQDQGVDCILDNLAAIKVPHDWFESFYAVSIGLSVFWMVMLTTLRTFIPFSTIMNPERPSTSFSQTQVAWLLLLCQGIRRYTECTTYRTASGSRMWFGHWFVGLGFYTGMSVAIWIEGTPALVTHEFTVHDLRLAAPSLRTAVSLLLFILASGIQHDCHAYLASLRNTKTKEKSDYQLPTFPAFSLTLTPHYLMECLIYLSLAMLAAPQGHWLNRTVCCALMFVATNLGVTAIGTRQWYEKKFGKEAIAGRYAMIPFVL